MWIKICAHTSLEDARAAAESGADAVGFVFARSPRQMTVPAVRTIVSALPAEIERVGIFAGATPGVIARDAVEAGLDAVQLHDGYSETFAAALDRMLPTAVQRIWTVPWRIGSTAAAAEVDAILDRLPLSAGRVLLDAKVGSASGGLGVALDWQAAAAVVARHPEHRIVLAGGLRPENVAEAIRIVRPWGVDVASGVESRPGLKDPAKVLSFIQTVRDVA